MIRPPEIGKVGSVVHGVVLPTQRMTLRTTGLAAIAITWTLFVPSDATWILTMPLNLLARVQGGNG